MEGLFFRWPRNKRGHRGTCGRRPSPLTFHCPNQVTCVGASWTQNIPVIKWEPIIGTNNLICCRVTGTQGVPDPEIPFQNPHGITCVINRFYLHLCSLPTCLYFFLEEKGRNSAGGTWKEGEGILLPCWNPCVQTGPFPSCCRGDRRKHAWMRTRCHHLFLCRHAQ